MQTLGKADAILKDKYMRRKPLKPYKGKGLALGRGQLPNHRPMPFTPRSQSSGGISANLAQNTVGSRKPQAPDQASVLKSAIRQRVNNGPISLEKNLSKQQAMRVARPPSEAVKEKRRAFGQQNRKRQGFYRP